MKKTYPIEQSRLYLIKSRKKLAELLGTSLLRLKVLCEQPGTYRVFTIHENGKSRIIEEPNAELKAIHGRLLVLLSRIEPPAYLHSGVKGRSYVSNAREHIGRGRILKTDVSKFYPSTTHRQVFIGFLRELRCSGDVAKLLADLCTFQGHIPTGSPISMPAAFLAHKQIFDAMYFQMRRRNIALTVYVDDITLSGESLIRLHLCPIKKAFEDIGLRVHKTRFFGSRPASVTGAIVKESSLFLPNRRHQKISDGLKQMTVEADENERLRLSSTIVGQIHEAANVDSRCRERTGNYLMLVARLLAKRGDGSIQSNPNGKRRGIP